LTQEDRGRRAGNKRSKGRRTTKRRRQKEEEKKIKRRKEQTRKSLTAANKHLVASVEAVPGRYVIQHLADLREVDVVDF